MKKIGKVTVEIKRILKISTDVETIRYNEANFIKHLIKRNHRNMLKYLPMIEDFLKNPDFIGVNPREKGISLEFVKQSDDNVLIGVKLDIKNGYFYLATMHEISNLKLNQRLSNGRLIKIDKKKKNDIIKL